MFKLVQDIRGNPGALEKSLISTAFIILTTGGEGACTMRQGPLAFILEYTLSPSKKPKMFKDWLQHLCFGGEGGTCITLGPKVESTRV